MIRATRHPVLLMSDVPVIVKFVDCFFEEIHLIYDFYKIYNNMEKYRRWTDEATGVNPFIVANTHSFPIPARLLFLVLNHLS